MKNLFYILLALPLTFACVDEPPDGAINSDCWIFNVMINGVTHRAQDCGPVYLYDNDAIAYLSDGYVSLSIQDQSLSSYVSGNNGILSLSFIDSISTGVLNCCVSGTWIMDAAQESGAYWSYGNAETIGGDPTSGCYGLLLPITITDLGTLGDGNLMEGNYLGGESLKGGYSGTIYLPSDTLNPFNLEYTIPMSIDIQFEALRLN